MNRHGQYFRKKTGQLCQRFLCERCGTTCSLLPADAMPYREMSVTDLEDCLDQFARGEHPTAFERAQQRAINAFTEHSGHIRRVLGQVISLGATTAMALWTDLRRKLGRASAIIGVLLRFRTSLLRTYRVRSHRNGERGGGIIRVPFTIHAIVTVPHNLSGAGTANDRHWGAYAASSET